MISLLFVFKNLKIDIWLNGWEEKFRYFEKVCGIDDRINMNYRISWWDWLEWGVCKYNVISVIIVCFFI